MIIKHYDTLLQQSVAHYSDCEKFRYLLRRDWDISKPAICFLMLNPSTATEIDNDPTIERCQRRAMTMNYGSMLIVNLFPFRMTDSRLLHTAADLIGDIDLANQSIIDAVKESEITVCGWGSHVFALARAKSVISILGEEHLSRIMCLDINQDGNPKHPLYVAYKQVPVPYVCGPIASQSES